MLQLSYDIIVLDINIVPIFQVSTQSHRTGSLEVNFFCFFAVKRNPVLERMVFLDVKTYII